MKSFLVTVVLYNKRPQEASTIMCLSQLSAAMKDNMKVVVWNLSLIHISEPTRRS